MHWQRTRLIGTFIAIVLPFGWQPVVEFAHGPVVPPWRACAVRPGYRLTTADMPEGQIAHLRVRFPTTCGHTVRAYYEHPGLFGTVTEVGPATRRNRSASSVFSRNASYCELGWEQLGRQGWRQIALSRRGTC